MTKGRAGSAGSGSSAGSLSSDGCVVPIAPVGVDVTGFVGVDVHLVPAVGVVGLIDKPVSVRGAFGRFQFEAGGSRAGHVLVSFGIGWDRLFCLVVGQRECSVLGVVGQLPDVLGVVGIDLGAQVNGAVGAERAFGQIGIGVQIAVAGRTGRMDDVKAIGRSFRDLCDRDAVFLCCCCHRACQGKEQRQEVRNLLHGLDFFG